MNNVLEIPVDIDEMRHWANGYRESTIPQLSWAKLSKECGIPAGTLQPFCKGNYEGNNERIARDIYRFRQTKEARAITEASLPVKPGYFKTPTSQRLQFLLEIAHTGRITVAATGPGTGKTMTIEDYRNCVSNVWVITMMPSTAKISPMVQQVQHALTLEVRHGNTASASRNVIRRINGHRGLLVFDEAQHMQLEAFEEIRSWYDATDVGVCFLGNDTLLDRIESGRQSDAFGRLNSRIARRYTQKIPCEEDAVAFCDAWGIYDPAIRDYLRKIALTPNQGGLRECAQLVETATMLAAADDRGLDIDDLRDAQSTRASRWVRA